MRVRAWTLFFVSSVFKWMPTALGQKKQPLYLFLTAVAAVCSLFPTSTGGPDLHFLSCVNAVSPWLDSRSNRGRQNPSASESGYSRDAIFSWLHFDNSGDFSIFFFSTFKRPWKRFYFDWVALLQRKEQKYFFLLRKKKKLVRLCFVFV